MTSENSEPNASSDNPDNNSKTTTNNQLKHRTSSNTALTSNSNGKHWWKVCWLYDPTNVLLRNTANKYATLPKFTNGSGSRCNIRKQHSSSNHHLIQWTSTLSSTTTQHMLPQHQNGFNANDDHDQQQQSSKQCLLDDNNPRTSSKTTSTNNMFGTTTLNLMSASSSSSSKLIYNRKKMISLDDMSCPLVLNNHNTQRKHDQSNAKSMTTLLNTSNVSDKPQQPPPTSMFTLPMTKFLIMNNHHGDVDDNNDEMKRFFNNNFTNHHNHQNNHLNAQQQILNVTQLLQNKIAQPLATWTKSKIIDPQQNRIINFLTDYKGSIWRDKQLEYQMPKHDEQLFGQQTAESKFIRNKRRKALLKTELCLLQNDTSCQKCKTEISKQVHCVKITIPRHHARFEHQQQQLDQSSAHHQTTNHHRYYHIDCFTCFVCQQILVDLKAYINPSTNHNNQRDHHLKKIFNKSDNYHLFCSRHFVEQFKPRCPSCDKLIFDEECTEAEGKAWHVGHFCCIECKRSLGGQQYIMAKPNNNQQMKTSGMNDDHQQQQQQQMPYCLTCFDILFGELCEECGELIGCEVGAIVHEGRSWHADERCFRCSLCMKNLLGKPFLPALDGRIYCSIACSQAMIAHRKKRLKKQNKLQTLHDDQEDHLQTIANKTDSECLGNVMIDNNTTTTSTNTTNNNQQQQVNNIIKQNRDNFIKSIIDDSTKTDDNNGHNDQMTTQPEKDQAPEKPSLRNSEQSSKLNLTQMIDYVEFIRKNNQCFTSKYDWSKEQEFLSISSSTSLNGNTTIGTNTTITASGVTTNQNNDNGDVSSQTTSGTANELSLNCNESIVSSSCTNEESNLIEQFNLRCDIMMNHQTNTTTNTNMAAIGSDHRRINTTKLPTSSRLPYSNFISSNSNSRSSSNQSSPAKTSPSATTESVTKRIHPSICSSQPSPNQPPQPQANVSVRNYQNIMRMNTASASTISTLSSPPPEYSNIDQFRFFNDLDNGSSVSNSSSTLMVNNNRSQQQAPLPPPPPTVATSMTTTRMKMSHTIDSIPVAPKRSDQSSIISSTSSRNSMDNEPPLPPAPQQQKRVHSTPIVPQQQQILIQPIIHHQNLTKISQNVHHHPLQQQQHQTIGKSKSVSFDPNIIEKTVMIKKSTTSVRRRHSGRYPVGGAATCNEHDDCPLSDEDSCSSCSTCSSSDDSDDDELDDDFDLMKQAFLTKQKSTTTTMPNNTNNKTSNRNQTKDNSTNNNQDACNII